MRFGRTLFIVAISLVFFVPVLAWGESAEEMFASGKARLSAGDFEEALKAFAAAAEADRENEAYLEEFSGVRKVLALRTRLAGEKDSGQWVRIARALHVYYLRREIYGEAISLGRQIHERLNSGLSASLLAQALMAKGDAAEAVRILADLPDEKQGMGVRATRVIALARAGRKDEALKLSRTVSLPEHLCAGKAFLLARMNAALGADEEAARLLKKAFSSAPRSRLAMFKQSARRCPEFEALFHNEKYAWVLQVQAENAQPNHDHDHDPGGHCANCPCQDGPQDINNK